MSARWNVEELVDVSLSPWKHLPRSKKKGKKTEHREEPAAAWAILCMRKEEAEAEEAGGGGGGITSQLLNGPHVHEMPDLNVPHTYIFNASTSEHQKRASHIALMQNGGGSFYPMRGDDGEILVDDEDQ